MKPNRSENSNLRESLRPLFRSNFFEKQEATTSVASPIKARRVAPDTIVKYKKAIHDADHRNLLIALLFQDFGIRIMDSREVREFYSKLAKAESPTEISGNYKDIRDLYAYVKVLNDVVKKKVEEKKSHDFFTILKSANRALLPEVFISTAINNTSYARTVNVGGFGTYADFLKTIKTWSINQKEMSDICNEIVQTFFDPNHSSEKISEFLKRSNDAVAQFNLLYRAIFTLLVIEPMRSPSAVIANAMALELVVKHQCRWDVVMSDAPMKKTSTYRQTTLPFVASQAPAVADAKGDAKSQTLQRKPSLKLDRTGSSLQIPTTVQGAVPTSEAFNFASKQYTFLEYSNYGAYEPNVVDADLTAFVNLHGRMLHEFVKIKSEYFSHESDANLSVPERALKGAVEKFKIISSDKKSTYDENFDALYDLVSAFVKASYPEMHLAQDVKRRAEDVLSEEEERAIRVAEEEAEEVQHFLDLAQLDPQIFDIQSSSEASKSSPEASKSSPDVSSVSAAHSVPESPSKRRATNSGSSSASSERLPSPNTSSVSSEPSFSKSPSPSR